MTAPHCRVSRVKPKNGGAVIEIMKTPPAYDADLVDMLVYVLAEARKGNVCSFALVFRHELDDGDIEFTQAYGLHKDADKRDSTILLGGMEKLKAYILKEQCSDE